MTRKAEMATGGTKEFFRRAKAVARSIDKAGEVPKEKVIIFDSPEELQRVMTPARTILLRQILSLNGPVKLADLAVITQRDRASIARDVKAMSNYAILSTWVAPNPGHGVARYVLAPARKLRLESEITAL